MGFKNILVGVSEDRASSAALEGAARLASSLGASLSPVHAHEHGSMSTAESDAMRASLERGLEGLSLEQTLHLERVRFHEGAPATVLLDEANNAQADLIVVGPHREHRMMFGSTARRLMSHSEKPILIQVGEAGPPKRILVSLDLTEGSRRTLAVAHELAQALGASLDLLHCYQGPAFAYSPSHDAPPDAPTYVVDGERRAEKEAFEAFVEQFDWDGVPHESLFVEDDPAHRILERQDRADLIVVGRHGHRGVLGALGSLSNQLHKVIEVPLLVIPHD